MDPPPRQPTKNPPECPQCRRALIPGDDGLAECGICHGRWLSNESFQTYLVSSTAPAENSQTPGGQHTFGRSVSPRVCPACDSCMDNYQFAYRSGIWIDACPDKHGVWLDAGELPMIRAYHQKTVGQPMTADEKSKMAMAFLDGATQSRSNISAASPRTGGSYDAEDSSYDYDNTSYNTDYY